ncbi:MULTISPECIES: protein-methionine-sulfoxide reductase heme-binding subunit MsrQ [unclassified Herbaspirillum]|uniref:sulfite oxidase heme-binding subunit YedZ n=1 Tax=unclassified Herbaspirillum TaxID=2624150 RepID=UPI000E2FEE15|nr:MULTISPECIES: protein-methionine-sulfoxide reductase heme-binding subunit MsrQ [unclassified Herbaspirillum]RFB67613.1 sulfoxide reductase heme-binding subunit YedZ [Herbaspirillum sp. 3R-3a1]TFI05221.1 sulfoxide reductase heme-binding subunit YedZ [Herbaspirillum sp. 3R11]TFI12449.1 sulfoxide reductase heme-binding subunit YedZ [Herbaspirillum sp. 3R-11]TFI22828.1 sulfoxide reductase heme-binding subunit YedZ [Herbaspirillum sp. 3C11]
MNALRNLKPRQVGILKGVLFVLALLPFVRLIAFGFLDRLGANPIEFITRNTGDWTLYFLCITLAVTPLRRLTGWNWLIRLRRMLGLFSFFYVVLHFMTFFWFDHFFDVEEMWRDVVKRPFITVGFIAFVLLIPLAATSTNAMVRRLGAKRWLWLHRLMYLILPLGILHFWWMKAGKNLLAQPILFATIVTILLLLRMFFKFQSRKTP